MSLMRSEQASFALYSSGSRQDFGGYGTSPSRNSLLSDSID
jgi:hypothetical protein